MEEYQHCRCQMTMTVVLPPPHLPPPPTPPPLPAAQQKVLDAARRPKRREERVRDWEPTPTALPRGSGGGSKGGGNDLDWAFLND